MTRDEVTAKYMKLFIGASKSFGARENMISSGKNFRISGTDARRAGFDGCIMVSSDVGNFVIRKSDLAVVN